jgi:hypothetical protein
MPEFFDTTKVDVIGGATRATPPRLSEAGIAYERDLLADAKWCEEHPANAEMLRRTLTEALAATGQDKEPAKDGRSPAQRLWDRQHAVEPHQPADYRDIPQAYQQFAAALLLPQHVAKLVVNDALSGGTKADAAKVLGEQTLKDAEALLSRVAHLPDSAKVKASDLSPHVIAQLAVWHRHLTKAQQSRPKS